MKDGYVKFNCKWIKSDLQEDILEVDKCRSNLYKLWLIGTYPNGIGFGNISIRLNEKEFIISGTETGKYETLNKEHYTKVTNYDFSKNSLECKGPIKASSESMTHAAVYMADKNINAVIHVHNLKLWKSLKGKVPGTPKTAEYGTPEMAYSVIDLFKKTDVAKKKIFIMMGHEEGIVVFGKNMEEAEKNLLSYFYVR
jgi:ribulose-5-phosphate 4-epimerase/fuculose-1-phosphate aldolase